MKKFLLLSTAFILFAQTNVYALESTFDDLDTTDYSHTTQNLKYFSEKDYQQAIEMYKNNFNKPKKVKKKDIKTPTSSFSNTESNPEFQILDEIINHKGSIMIPAACITEDGQQIMPGYYSLEYFADNDGQQWLILSQSTKTIVKILSTKSKAYEKQDTINYAYAQGQGNVIKLLYGNIDIAVEAYLTVVN